MGDPTYTIFNDFDFSIGISGLEFLIDVPEIDPSLLLPGAMDGFSLTQPDFILAAHSSMAFDIPGTIAPGNFLYAQGHLFDPVSGDELGAFIHGHQQPISEPSVFGLLGIGLLILRNSWKRRRSR